MNVSSFMDGAEGPENNPYQYMRLGRIDQVIDETVDKTSDKDLYHTLVVDWLDRAGKAGSTKSKTTRIQLVYSHISRGWGLVYKPSIGDIVVCGFASV